MGAPGSAPTSLTVLGISPTISLLRWLALIGLLLSVPIAVYAFLRKRGEAFEESVQIQAQYGHLIVPIVAGEDLGWPPVDVANIKALVRLAESGQRLILHNRSGDVDTYMVNDEGTVYRYQVRASKVVWGEWTDAPVPSQDCVRRRPRERGAGRRQRGLVPVGAGELSLRRRRRHPVQHDAVGRDQRADRAGRPLGRARPQIADACSSRPTGARPVLAVVVIRSGCEPRLSSATAARPPVERLAPDLPRSLLLDDRALDPERILVDRDHLPVLEHPDRLRPRARAGSLPRISGAATIAHIENCACASELVMPELRPEVVGVVPVPGPGRGRVGRRRGRGSAARS